MDTELVVLAQRGDQLAFERLAEAIDDHFHGVAYGILRDMQLAEDAVQTALLSMWRDLPRLRDAAAFDHWSYRLLVRACYAESRRERRWLPSVRLSADGGGSADGGIGAIVERDRLEGAFRRLSLEHRVVIVLRHYLDQSLDQVAATLSIAPGTARSRLHRSMQALRAALEAEDRATNLAPERRSPETLA